MGALRRGTLLATRQLRRLAVFSVAGLLLLPAVAAIEWQGTSGGNMDDPANWGISAFGASDQLQVNKAQSNPLTLSADWSPYRLSIQPGAGSTTVLDLKGKTLLASERVFIEKGSTVLLTNGVFGCQPGADRIFVGDGTAGGNVLIVDGPGAEMRTGAATSTASRYMVIGQKGSSNKVIVRNGGALRGCVRFTGDSATAKDNLLLITDPGSSYSSIDERDLYLGMIGPQNAVVVSNSASFVASNTVSLAPYSLGSQSNFKGLSWGNRFEVVDDAVATVVGNLIVGGDGASNVCTVARGGRLTVTGPNVLVGYGSGPVSNAVGNLLHVAKGGKMEYVPREGLSRNGLVLGDKPGMSCNEMLVEGDLRLTNLVADANANYRIGPGSASNRLVVANGGTFRAEDMPSFYIGSSVNNANAQACVGNVLAITNGGTVTFTSMATEPRVYVGSRSPQSGVLLDRGSFNVPHWYVIIGTLLGSSLSVQRLIVSDKTPGSLLVVSNSSINVGLEYGAGTFDVAYSAYDPDNSSLPSVPTNIVVRIGGTNTSIRVKNQFRLENDATLVVGIPAMEKMSSPVISCSGFNTTLRTYSRKPTLRVEVDGLQRIGQSVTLVETTNAITDADWNNLNVEVPEGVTVVREQKRIVAKVLSTLGTMLIFR